MIKNITPIKYKKLFFLSLLLGSVFLLIRTVFEKPLELLFAFLPNTVCNAAISDVTPSGVFVRVQNLLVALSLFDAVLRDIRLTPTEIAVL